MNPFRDSFTEDMALELRHPPPQKMALQAYGTLSATLKASDSVGAGLAVGVDLNVKTNVVTLREELSATGSTL